MLNLIELEALMTSAMETAKVPGAALAIVHERKLIYARGFGVTSVEDGGTAVTPGTIFRIGSTSKPITTTAIMQMVASGQLELDTPIDEVMPDFQFSVPGAVKEVTLRKLLSHTAGLPTAAEHYGTRDVGGLREGIYTDVASYPLVAPVGKIWSYSNPGINLAGYIAERVSGKPFAQLIQELVFEPLEMKRSTFDPTIAMTYPVAQSHTLTPEGKLAVDHHYADNSMHYPSGFVMSTVLDMANFAIMHLSGGSFGGKQILPAELVEEMHTPVARFNGLYNDGYGLTLSSFDYKGVRVVGHGGNISSFASMFEFVPQTGTAIILQVNNSALWQGSQILHYILDNLLDLPAEVPAPAPIEPDRSQWDRLVGMYIGANSGAAEIQRDGDQLMLVWQMQSLPLITLRPDLMIAKMPDGNLMAVSFDYAGDGTLEYLNIVVAPGHLISLTRLEIDPAFTPNPAEWTAFAGTYESPLTKLVVKVEGDQMLVSSPLFGNVEFPAKSVGPGKFVFPVGLLTFEPDSVLLGVLLRFPRV
ncbi:MAG: serine hydrolase domain-containing protein [Anaerolineae bacterium]